MSKSNRILHRIRRAYDLTVGQFDQEVDSFDSLPEDFKKTKEFRALTAGSLNCNTGNSEVRAYLDPGPGEKFLDAGCGAGLVTYQLYQWPSVYYGVDISPELIEAMKGFVKREDLRIGDLKIADLTALPYPDNFFDIAACIGVFEYYDLSYIIRALKELSRVLKHEAKLVLDIPNQAHPHYPVMVKLEKYLGRPHQPFTRTEFEELLDRFFSVIKVNDSKVMINYFLKA